MLKEDKLINNYISKFFTMTAKILLITEDKKFIAICKG